MSSVNLLETSLVLVRATGDASIWEPLDVFVEESEVEIVAFDSDQAQHRAGGLSPVRERTPPSQA